uniref:Reverse transcriptase RNase H-like domain-containing protein n=1 Tax=Trichuris muris TaxID=70415 RepID=A0A5S6QPS1_TRIMR
MHEGGPPALFALARELPTFYFRRIDDKSSCPSNDFSLPLTQTVHCSCHQMISKHSKKQNKLWRKPLAFLIQVEWSVDASVFLIAAFSTERIHWLEGRTFTIFTDHKPIVQSVHRASAMCVILRADRTRWLTHCPGLTR